MKTEYSRKRIFGIRQIQITPTTKNSWQNRIIGAAFQVAAAISSEIEN
jgi:hypothetical protein